MSKVSADKNGSKKSPTKTPKEDPVEEPSKKKTTKAPKEESIEESSKKKSTKTPKEEPVEENPEETPKKKSTKAAKEDVEEAPKKKLTKAQKEEIDLEATAAFSEKEPPSKPRPNTTKMNDIKNNYDLFIKTVQTSTVKQVFDKLARAIAETRILFVNGKDGVKGGVKISRVTEQRDLLVNLHWYQDRFETFYCAEDHISVGIELSKLNTALKSFKEDYSIQMFIKKNNRTTLFLQSFDEKNGAFEKTCAEVTLMEIPEQKISLNKTNFEATFMMDCAKFHENCKSLSTWSDEIEITCIGGQIEFSAKSESGKIVKEYSDSEEDQNNKAKKKVVNPKDIIYGKFELKNLVEFSKCAKLTKTIEINMKNDFPLVLGIHTADLGKMWIYFSPIENAEKPDAQK